MLSYFGLDQVDFLLEYLEQWLLLQHVDIVAGCVIFLNLCNSRFYFFLELVQVTEGFIRQVLRWRPVALDRLKISDDLFSVLLLFIDDPF